MLGTILSWALKILGVLPNLVVGMENLWSGVPKSGNDKWVGVEAAVAGSIEQAAEAAAKLAPAGTKAEVIATAIDKFTKAVNDAFVTLANDLGLFPKGGTPGVNQVVAPAAESVKSS